MDSYGFHLKLFTKAFGLNPVSARRSHCVSGALLPCGMPKSKRASSRKPSAAAPPPVARRATARAALPNRSLAGRPMPADQPADAGVPRPASPHAGEDQESYW